MSHISEIDKVLSAGLESAKRTGNTHFYLGFKECYGLFGVGIRKSNIYNLHLENKRLSEELSKVRSDITVHSELRKRIANLTNQLEDLKSRIITQINEKPI